jgi:hypothetical protein
LFLLFFVVSGVFVVPIDLDDFAAFQTQLATQCAAVAAGKCCINCKLIRTARNAYLSFSRFLSRLLSNSIGNAVTAGMCAVSNLFMLNLTSRFACLLRQRGRAWKLVVYSRRRRLFFIFYFVFQMFVCHRHVHF